jgi:hypothetical protein
MRTENSISDPKPVRGGVVVMDSITGLLLTQYRGQIQAYRDGKDLLHPPDGWHHMLGEETVGGQKFFFARSSFW